MRYTNIFLLGALGMLVWGCGSVPTKKSEVTSRMIAVESQEQSLFGTFALNDGQYDLVNATLDNAYAEVLVGEDAREILVDYVQANCATTWTSIPTVSAFAVRYRQNRISGDATCKDGLIVELRTTQDPTRLKVQWYESDGKTKQDTDMVYLEYQNRDSISATHAIVGS